MRANVAVKKSPAWRPPTVSGQPFSGAVCKHKLLEFKVSTAFATIWRYNIAFYKK